MMNSPINFIREFQLSNYGLDMWDLLAIAGVFALAFVLIIWMLRFLQPATENRIKKIVIILFGLVFYAVLCFASLHSFLAQDYAQMIVSIFLLALPTLKKWTGVFFDKYDNLVDRIINKIVK